MNILIIAPGHTMSTKDVFDYISKASELEGYKTFHFNLHDRIILHQYLFESLSGRIQEINMTNPNWKLHLEYDLFRISTEYADTFTHRKAHALALRGDKLDMILVVTGSYITGDIVELLKDYGAPVVLYETEDPYEKDLICEKAKVYDWLFINDNINLDCYRAINPHTFYCPTACWPKIHHPYDPDPQYENDVVLVGTGFFDRQILLERIAPDLEAMGIKISLWGGWPRVDKGSPLYKFHKGEIIPNSECAKLYSNSKIVLNMHRKSKSMDELTEVKGNGLSPRIFEAAAVGAFQISDDNRSELTRLFPEAVTFKDGDPLDLLDKIKYWLDPAHEIERMRIAETMQKRALTNHTYSHRLHQIVNTVCGGE